MARFNIDEYDPVDSRIQKFWAEHPNGAIHSRIIPEMSTMQQVLYESQVFFDKADPIPAGTDCAYGEIDLNNPRSVNATSWHENASTSAVGRALANAGYKAKKDSPRPSREEMEKSGAFDDTPRAAPQGFQRDAAARAQQQAAPAAPRPAQPAPRAAAPKGEQIPKGLYAVDKATGELVEFPDVSRTDGVTTMDGLNTYLKANGFAGGFKGQIVKELAGTYNIDIRSGRGENQYGDPDCFPGEIYSLANFFITATNADAQGGALVAVGAAAGNEPPFPDDDEVPF